MKRWWTLAALALILALGAGFRVYDIAGNPPELIVDELDLYNSARSIATTGRDVDGSLLPFLFCAFTRNPPMYAVAEYPVSLVLGNGPLGLRLPAIVFGLLTILLAYGIAFELTRRSDVALVTVLLVATSPIFIHFSRIAWEPDSELPFLLGGIYLWLRAFLRPGFAWRPLLWGAALFALTSYTYMAGLFYSAILGGGMVLLNAWRLRRRRSWTKVAAAACLWLAIAAPALWMWFFNAQTDARTARISTFGRGVSLSTLQTFAANYFAHFRWSYLVTTGDPIPGMTWRYMNGFGAFFWWTIALAVIGLFVPWRYVHARWALGWILLWALAYPLGGALTNESIPNAPRTLAGAPVFCLFAAFGFVALTDLARSFRPAWVRTGALLAVRGFFTICLVVSLVSFSNFYFTKYPHLAPYAWDSGTRALFAEILDVHDQYDRMCFSVDSAWYGARTYFRYYLAGVQIPIEESVEAWDCFGPGTLLVSDSLVRRPGFSRLATIDNSRGMPFAYVEGRPR